MYDKYSTLITQRKTEYVDRILIMLAYKRLHWSIQRKWKKRVHERNLE